MALKGTTGLIGGSLLALGAVTTGTVTISGIQPGDVCTCSPDAYPGDGIDWCAYCLVNDIATVRLRAVVAGTPTAAHYKVWVNQ